MLLTNFENFVPLTRTPWAGAKIAEIKKESLGHVIGPVDALIGESWEVSTEPSFPSRVINKDNKLLTDVIASNQIGTLGEAVVKRYGSHCPLLLKWLHAADTLSVQLHPNHSNPQLKSNECGKPESWIVLDVEEGGFVYVGFKEGVTKEQVRNVLVSGDPDTILHKIFPKKHEVISIPTGLIHATGRGVLIAEPQYVLPGKVGKTWRLSDWGRLYDEKGRLDPKNGKARELHLDDALPAIEWSYPQGLAVEKAFMTCLSHGQKYLGDKHNPFATLFFDKPGKWIFDPFFPNTFSLFTCIFGRAKLRTNAGSWEVLGGQSGIVEAAEPNVTVDLEPDSKGRAEIAFFSLNLQLAES